MTMQKKLNMFTIQLQDINLHDIIGALADIENNMVYILNGVYLYGIISRGDVKRYLQRDETNIENLIFRKFRYIHENELDSIESKLEADRVILEIPVVNNSMELLYVLRKDLPNNIINWEKINSFKIEMEEFMDFFGGNQLLIINDTKNIDIDIDINTLIMSPYHLDLRQINNNTLILCISDVVADFLNEVLDINFISFNTFIEFLEFGKIEELVAKKINVIASLYSKVLYKTVRNIKGYLSNLLAAFTELKTESVILKGNKKYYSGDGSEIFVNFMLQRDRIENIYSLDFFSFLLKGYNSGYLSRSSSVYYDMQKSIIPALRNNGVKIVYLLEPKKAKLHQNFHYHIKKFYEAEPDELEGFIDLKEFNDIKDNNMKYSDIHGFASLIDVNKKYYNFNNMVRYTVGNKATNINNIYMFGPCLIHGSYVSDKHTIASYLQQYIPHYNIINKGENYRTINFVMRTVTYSQNDIALIMVDEDFLVSDCKEEKIDLMDVYSELPDNCNYFWDHLLHVNYKVTELIARLIYKRLNKQLFASRIENKPNKFVAFGNKGADTGYYDLKIKQWINENHYSEYCSSLSGSNGSIVMNCNPFTYGHKYLIETASSQCERLFIFVVEENKSEFSFDERYELVKNGVKDINNVVVLKSGFHMISYKTMPGYFDKENLNQKGEVCDYSLDLMLFGKYIAKYFGITKRFVGMEPYDNFTNNYNEAMKLTLPRYGVDIYEIERLKANNTFISASYVRSLIKKKNWLELKEYVPDVTYDLIKKKFMKEDCN